MSRINDNNYYQISGWMINRLKLKGVALSAYAIIYGFSQDDENEFTGSLQYLCDFCGGISKPTIIKALKELTEKEYIIRREEIINGVTFVRYKINLEVVKKLYQGSKETLQGGSKETLTGGSKETLPNNNIPDNNIIDNKSDNKKERKKDSFDKIIAAYTDDEETINLLREWLKVRKAKRAAMTDRAIEMNISKLDNLAGESGFTVKQYLSEIICRGWAAFYVIKNYSNQQQNGNNYGAEQRQTINGKDYIYKNGKYYIPNGSGVAVNPYAKDDLPF